MTTWSILDGREGVLRIQPDGTVRNAPELAPDLDGDAWANDQVNRPVHGAYAGGAIAVGFAKRRLLVRYDVHRVDEKARQQLFTLLREDHRDRTVLSCFRFGGWFVEPSPSARKAVKLHEEMAALASSRPLEQTALDPLCPTQGAAESRTIASLLKDWRRQGRRAPPGHLPALASSLKGGLILSMDDDGTDLYLAHVGAQSAVASQYGADWKAAAVGQSVTVRATAPQHEARVCSTYRPVMEGHRPYFDHVLGCLDLEPGYNVWVRYRRLILPFELDNGTPALFVYCEQNHSVFTPFMQRQ